MVEPVSVGLIVIVSVLACERIIRYIVGHVKKSECCGAKIDFKENTSKSDINMNNNELISIPSIKV